ncbi:lasso peptide biosynthesis PqqD family chaperone [Aliikangiella coralliicola]|uniref:Lasso peptide biosynthesis PqqD family chaperone n=1 Tax=Aliikangiella coralliicola TaxID=2592383 RepID=A0A545U793_9GAMM|nr:lasso peptide biosynthesis PqqD family chaperone [Aliikangiella coralliicola]TQV85347.1 lasso peptide biosynthesis PqqD family chaperone [Aliikangiella coralliicola]
MTNIGMSTQIERNSEVVEALIDGETVMMDIESGNYYGLDLIATRIWQLIEKPLSVQAICSQLLSEYDVSEEQCHQDVIDFINQMAQVRTVTIA